MLDVHPPHHAASTWRDFFIHIATIVVGLLIAIGLEQTVEWFHHQHIVHAARENIRHEIDTNREQVTKNLAFVQTDADSMKTNLAAAKILYAHPGARQAMHFDFIWSSFDQSAWLSARDSGALTYMPVEEVQRYADVYNQQQIVNDAAVKLFTDQIAAPAPMMIAPDSQPSDPADIKTVMHSCAELYFRLNGLHQLIQQLGDQYKDTLEH